jgi:squalene-associated FAD-dependent desaturase
LSTEVVVIGGGFAGLSAATALAEAGRLVTVLEARPALGGRATAFTDPATGERVDNGQHVLLGCYHETFRFLRRIGAADHVWLQPELALDIVERSGRASRLTCPPLPPPLHLLAGLMAWKALTWRDRVAALRVGIAVRGRAASRHARTATVREWLISKGQTARLIELLWEPLAVAALNQPIDVASAAPFVVVLRRMFGRHRQDAALGLPLKPLDELYAIPAAAYVTGRGGCVRTGAPARLHCAPLTVRVRDEPVAAAVVICAVPWYALAGVIDNPPRALAPVLAAAASTGASPIVTINLWFDRIVTRRQFVGLPGRSMQWVFDKRLLFGDGSSHLSLVSSGAEAIVARSNDDLVRLAMEEVVTALPAAGAARLRRAVVVRERRATFSVAPGQPARPQTRTGVDGLFLAGDWIETGLPATIESAVVSGHRAAAAALEYLKASRR